MKMRKTSLLKLISHDGVIISKGKIYPIYILIILSIYIITISAISKNLFSPYLWFDEAGQFWIAKGLNHDSDPMAHINGLSEVIENNKYYNMDPGGFSVLLHFWTYLSNQHEWLRLLSFLFFIGVVISFIYLSYVWVKNLHVALIMGFIPICTPILLHFGFEVRAYSMECLGTVLSVVALEKLRNNLSNKYLFLWGCILSFFMTSRYSEIIVVAVVCIYVLFLIFRSDPPLKHKILSSIIFSLPLIATLIYIYFFALAFQNKNLQPVWYLRYLSSNISILLESRNFLSLCLIGLLLILLLLKERFLIIKRYESFLFVFISVNVLFIILSFLGKHPWDFSVKNNYQYAQRCISLYLLFSLCVSALLGELLVSLFKRPGILKYYVLSLLLVCVLFLRKTTLFPRMGRHNTYFNFQTVDTYNFHHIYVDRWESCCVRYLFEYGALKERMKTIYPTNFTFSVKYGHHRATEGEKMALHDFYNKQPKMNSLLEYDLIIASFLNSYGNNDKWKLMDGTTNFYIKKQN